MKLLGFETLYKLSFSDQHLIPVAKSFFNNLIIQKLIMSPHVIQMVKIREI